MEKKLKKGDIFYTNRSEWIVFSDINDPHKENAVCTWSQPGSFGVGYTSRWTYDEITTNEFKGLGLHPRRLDEFEAKIAKKILDSLAKMIVENHTKINKCINNKNKEIDFTLPNRYLKYIGGGDAWYIVLTHGISSENNYCFAGVVIESNDSTIEYGRIGNNFSIYAKWEDITDEYIK